MYDKRGFLQLKHGAADKAILDFNKAIELKPGFVQAYRHRAATYAKLGDTARAEADQSKATELEGPAPPAETDPHPELDAEQIAAIAQKFFQRWGTLLTAVSVLISLLAVLRTSGSSLKKIASNTHSMETELSSLNGKLSNLQTTLKELGAQNKPPS
jgi:tetratricopeptide (TPR) repeat protein